MRARIDPHAKFRELIAARLDKPLTRVELRTLNSHLKKCAGCEQVDLEYRAQRNLLRGLPEPIPPRDLWARTSSSLDREVAHAYRTEKWRRQLARSGRRSAQPSTALMTAIAAIGVSAAVAVLQLAPAIGPIASVAVRATPLTIPRQQVVYVGVGPSDIAVYQTELNQVCPATGPIDCVDNERYVRTPFTLPPDVRAGNMTLSPSGDQLAIVGHKGSEDVIAVVMMPGDDDGNDKGGKSNSGGEPAATIAETQKTHDPGNSLSDPVTAPGGNPDVIGQPADSPPPSVIPGLTVLSILDNVQSAGSAPDWSPNTEMLAFSAMPDDESTGPDVYVWSPGDAKARAITDDHKSYFASWSGNRIVVSRISAGKSRPHNFVIDPASGEERAVSGPQLWLPSVDHQRVQAVGWFGQLDTSGSLPVPRSGALYFIDWRTVDPFATAAAPQPTPTAEPTTEPTTEPDPTATPDDEATPEGTDDDLATDQPDGMDNTDGENAPPDATATPVPTDGSTDGQTPRAATPTSAPADSTTLVALEPDRDPRAAPVVDWQARWSADGEVLGVWIADSAGSSWGRLAVFAADPATELVTGENQLLPMTLARRGFTLGANRVAWVGPADDNIDGELRIRTWGGDGVGGLRLKPPGQEEVTPAS